MRKLASAGIVELYAVRRRLRANSRYVSYSGLAWRWVLAVRMPLTAEQSHAELLADAESRAEIYTTIARLNRNPIAYDRAIEATRRVEELCAEAAS